MPGAERKTQIYNNNGNTLLRNVATPTLHDTEDDVVWKSMHSE